MTQFKPGDLYDALGPFDLGMNGNQSPLLLNPRQLAHAQNATVRGAHISHRAAFRKLTLSGWDATTVQTRFEDALFQGAGYYNPDNSDAEKLLVSIGGRLFTVTPSGDAATVVDVSIGSDLNSATEPQAWIWQSEKWGIVQNGFQRPLFYSHGSTTRRSADYNILATLTAAAVAAPAINSSVSANLLAAYSGPTPRRVAVFTAAGVKLGEMELISGALNATLTNNLYGAPVPVLPEGTEISLSITGGYSYFGKLVVASTGTIAVGASRTVQLDRTYTGTGQYTWIAYGSGITGVAITAYTPSATAITLKNLTVPPTTALADCTLRTLVELPPGRMGAYGRGRNWVSLAGGRDFLAGDIIGGSSGTSVEKFRDAVLNVTENSYLNGGGTFPVPGSSGDIQGMIFQARLDVSQGHGPLAVLTPDSVFSCDAPVDRSSWAAVTNPILTESLIANGGQGQWSTVNANGDVIFRSLDGIRSQILGQRDFEKWGNTPMSNEVNHILSADDSSLLRYSSAVVFDNRLLMTATPTAVASHGVYHSKLIALNFDPISNLQGKLPSVYDGVWTGLNVLQLVKGMFSGVERCYAFCLNSNKIEVWEIRKSVEANYDGTSTAIEWYFDSASLDFGETDPRTRRRKGLANGEIQVDNFIGPVTFSAYYKPDQYPTWTLWRTWTEAAAGGDPGFRPRMGLGEPSATDVDTVNGRPLREGYTFQFRLVVSGHCRFLGARFKAVAVPETEFAPPN